MASMLRTPRLLLREWCEQDLQPFVALSADPAVMKYLMPLGGETGCAAMVERIQTHFAAHGFGFWAVEIPGEAPFIGLVGLAVVAFDAHFTPAIEIGWRLATRYWGRGLATEAAAAALGFGFGTLGCEEIVAFTVPDNCPSRRVMERLGMTRAELDDFDHPRVPPDHRLRRHVLYRIARQDWVGRGRC